MIASIRRKHGDCAVTAIARALSVPYERAASMVGVVLDEDGTPQIEESGLAINQMIPHLWKNGIAGVHLVSSAHVRSRDVPNLPSPAAVLDMCRGYKAIVGPICFCLSSVEADHWFAFDGDQIVEDRAAPAEPIPIMREYCNQIGPVLEALILLERKGLR